MFNFQMIPLLALTAYIFYLTYYYAVPMFCLKILLFRAHIRYRGIEIRFSEYKITVKIPEEEIVMERVLEMDPTSRFFAMTVCSSLNGMLRDIRKNRKASGEDIHVGTATDLEERKAEQADTDGPDTHGNKTAGIGIMVQEEDR